MTEALVIFARYPRFGQVKTRLHAKLGEERCLQLHSALLLDTLDKTAALSLPRFLYIGDCSEEERREFAEDHLKNHPIPVRRQCGADLGERLWNAYSETSGVASRVLLLGIDSPTLPLQILRQAQHQLRKYSVVVGPCRDGGYYTIGLSKPRAQLFQGIDWGSSRVLDQTLDRLTRTRYYLLPTWGDVDTWHDLLNLKVEFQQTTDQLAVRTRNLLNSDGFLPADTG